VIGVASDRTWLWLISMILGPLLYYVIRDSLSNVSYLLGYLYDRSLGRSTRLALLSMVQVVTASTQRTQTRTSDGPGGRGSIAKISVISMVLTLPIVLSILIVYDWYYFVSHGIQISCPDPNAAASSFTIQYLCRLGVIQRYTMFFEEPEFWGGILTIPVLAFEAVLFYRIYGLLTNLSMIHQKVRGS